MAVGDRNSNVQLSRNGDVVLIIDELPSSPDDSRRRCLGGFGGGGADGCSKLEFDREIDVELGLNLEGKAAFKAFVPDCPPPRRQQLLDSKLSASRQLSKRLQSSQRTAQWLDAGLEEFRVELRRDVEGRELGVDVEYGATGLEHLRVMKVKDGGMMEAWNEANSGIAVKGGDAIVEVNGVRGSVENMLSALRNSQTLKIVVGRARKRKASKGRSEAATTRSPPSGSSAGVLLGARATYQVTVTKTEAGLGLDINPNCDNCLFILDVRDGVIKEWNQAAASDCMVQPGHSIVQVNGTAGLPSQLIEAVKTSETSSSLVLTMDRPA